MTAEPRRRTALAPHADALAGIGAREILLGSQISVRADPAATRELGLPVEPNSWVTAGGRDALWLGPDEWLVTSATEAAADVERDLEARLTGHRSVLDVSANRVAIELAGPGRLELLSAGCGLDFDPRSWRTGMCAQTLLANVAVLLQERGAATHVLTRPSFAGHLVTWLGRVGSAVDTS